MIGMDYLLKLDIAKAMPIFRDYLMVMNELIQHPDARYIDCEEAYKQCLWLEGRGYKAARTKAGPSAPPAAPTVVFPNAKTTTETLRRLGRL